MKGFFSFFVVFAVLLSLSLAFTHARAVEARASSLDSDLASAANASLLKSLTDYAFRDAIMDAVHDSNSTEPVLLRKAVADKLCDASKGIEGLARGRGFKATFHFARAPKSSRLSFSPAQPMPCSSLEEFISVTKLELPVPAGEAGSAVLKAFGSEPRVVRVEYTGGRPLEPVKDFYYAGFFEVNGFESFSAISPGYYVIVLPGVSG